MKTLEQIPLDYQLKIVKRSDFIVYDFWMPDMLVVSIKQKTHGFFRIIEAIKYLFTGDKTAEIVLDPRDIQIISAYINQKK